MHRKITQCKLHAGMRPYVHNKYFNWLALDMIQRFNTRTGVLKRTRDVILSSNIIFNSKGVVLAYQKRTGSDVTTLRTQPEVTSYFSCRFEAFFPYRSLMNN